VTDPQGDAARGAPRPRLLATLRDLVTPGRLALPPGDVRGLVADVLGLLGVLALLTYALTWIFLPLVHLPTRLISGAMACLPFVLRAWMLRREAGSMPWLPLALLLGGGTLWVMAAGSVYSAHPAFFLLVLVFVAFMFGLRAALAGLGIVAALLALLAWSLPDGAARVVRFTPISQAWLHLQFCLFAVVCALVLRRFVARAHADSLAAREASARDAVLAAQGTRLAMALRAAGASAWEYDAASGRFFTDGRLEPLLGPAFSDGERSPQLLRERLTEASRPAFDDALHRLLHGGPSDTQIDVTLRARPLRGAGDLHLHVLADIVRGADGRTLRASGLILDETVRERERDAVRAAMEQARRAAETANRAKSRFIANVSHDIRTPAGAVIALTRLALERPGTPEAAQHLRRAEAAATSLLALLDDVLDLSRLEAGKLPLTPVRFELAELIETLTGTLSHAARDKGLDLVVDAAADLPTHWHTDRLRLYQVLQNLVGNAVKFTPAGEVRLRVERAGAEHLAFEVSDTGPGLDAATRRRVFEPFEQGDAETGRRHGGSGLGLSIARDLVQLLGGELTLQTAPGEGCHFRFVIPAQRMAAPSPTAGPGAADPAPVTDPVPPVPPGLRVLLVEDNETLRVIGEAMLASLEARVQVCADAEQALDCLERQAFDLVLMDIQLPGLDGLAATRRLRESEGPNRAVPVVALTAHALEHEARASREAGMIDHLVKPVTPQRLAHALARHARRA
jgi:signal transduction histidine kinase/CheY-like chemotaxis protein